MKLNQILLFKGNCKLLKFDKMWVWVMDGRATHSQSQSSIFSNSQSRRSELTRDARPELGDPRHLTMYSDIQDACAIICDQVKNIYRLKIHLDTNFRKKYQVHVVLVE